MPEELSTTAGNPAHAMRQNYQELMQLAQADGQACTQRMLEICQPLVGKGMSPQNWKKMQQELQRINGDSTKLIYYISNFILAADNHRAIGNPGRGRFANESSIAAIAGYLTEDASRPSLDAATISNMKLLSPYGLIPVPINEFNNYVDLDDNQDCCGGLGCENCGGDMVGGEMGGMNDVCEVCDGAGCDMCDHEMPQNPFNAPQPRQRGWTPGGKGPMGPF